MDYRERRLINGVIIVILLAIATVVVVALLTGRQKGVAFTIVFKDAQGLPVGAPVTLRGLRVGEVNRVELAQDREHVEVDVSIFPAYGADIPEPGGVTARIKKSLLLPGNFSVALIKRKDAKGHMPNGARIEGVENWAGEKSFQARGAIRTAYRAAMEKASDKMDQFKQWWANRAHEKERKEIQHQLLAWLDEWENLDPEAPPSRIEALRKKADIMAQEWRKNGFEEEAKQLEDAAKSLADMEKAESAS